MTYVLCTDGSKGSSDREMTGEELSRIRREEQVNAGKVLGLKDVAFLDYPDSYLEATLDLRRDIAREIRRHRPDVVICWYPMRNLDGGWGVGHPDHLAAGEATLAAVFPTARDHMTFPELLDDGFEPHKVAEVWIMGQSRAGRVHRRVGPPRHGDQGRLPSTSRRRAVASYDELLDRMKDWRRRASVGTGMMYSEGFKRISFRR